MKKKILAILICTTMAATMLSGCGKGKEEIPEEPAMEEEAVVETPEVEEPEVEEPVEEAGLAPAEALPETAAYHFSFDGNDPGIHTVVRVDDVGDNDGANFGLVESDTYIDADGNEQPVQLQYESGPVEGALYLDGNFGLKFDVEALNTETYTISFWMNADRLSTFGPTLQMGRNIGKSTDVTWLNFTQTEWGSDNSKIFPVVWNRNSETEAWPWVYAADDAIHGKKEWVMVTLVATGNIYNYTEDSIDRNGCQLYIDGVLAFDATDNAYGGLATGIMDSSEGFECLFGINYWDSIFKGYIDDFYIYDQALTPGQVASLFLLGDTDIGTASVDDSLNEEPVPQVVTTIDPNAIATVGTVTCDNGFWSSFSDGYELKDGKSLTFNFNNYGSGINVYENYLLAFCNVPTTADLAPSAENYEGYLEYGVLRSDAFAWAFDGDPEYEFSWEAANFVEIMMNAKVNLTISRNGENITVDGIIKDAKGTEYTYKVAAKTTAAPADPMYVFMLNEKSYIEILSVE